MRLIQAVTLLAGLALGGALAADDALPAGLYAEFATPHGTFTAELFYTRAPLMCANFTGLAEGTLAPRDGHPFYTGLTWYRVVPGFVIQSGNPGFKDTDEEPAPNPHHLPDEFVPGLRHDAAGVLSMANSGPDTNGGEFFVTLRDTNRLNYLHSVFGRVVRGLAVLPQIRPGEALAIRIRRIGPAAEAFRNDAAACRALADATKKYSGPALPGPAAAFDDPDGLLPAEPPRAKNFNFKLANFERITGVKLRARLYAQAPAAAEDAVPGAYMHALAGKLGVDRQGALVAHFADDDWRMWLSDEAAARFLGHPATPADLVPEGPLHQLKTPFIDAAVAEGDAAFAEQQQAAPPGQPVPSAQRLKLETDALLDRLIFKLEPPPTAPAPHP